ncbi:MAG: alpha-L-rhamnosidase C-terminal domain-containing protein [Bacteroidales bacterium]
MKNTTDKDTNLFLISLAFLVILSVTTGCNHFDKNHAPSHLMVDLLTSPEKAVITNPNPAFSWAIDDSRLGARQTAYQIMVVSSSEYIYRNLADMWDSGIVPSDQSVSIPYEGNPLQPGQTYWWKVKVWDQDNKVGNWSTAQEFHVGEFDRNDLKWPGESRWVEFDTDDESKILMENRHTISYTDIMPVSVVINQAGNHFISFEKAAFGTLKLSLDEPEEPDTLIVHLGEHLTTTRQVDTFPGGSVVYKKLELILEPGKKDYMVEIPRQFSQYPNSQVLADHMPEVTSFRYAEIEGLSGPLNTDQVMQHALLYEFDDNSSDFHSSDDNLNQIWGLCKHTLKVTPFLGLYIDGTRERMPYEADAYIQQISHYCVDREFAIQRYTNSFLIYNPSWPTEWHLHIVLMAWADYMATGDTQFLETYYDELKKKTLLPLARGDGLISSSSGLVTDEFLESIHYKGSDFRDIVDWPQGTPANLEPVPGWFGSIRVEGETDRYIFSEINTVVNAFHYRNLVLMAKIAGILNKAEDEVFFAERSELVKTSINEKLLDKETGLYKDGEGIEHNALHASMFPVAFGLAPEENYPRLKEFFISKGMACSPYGAPYLFDALYEVGAEDYALELLTSESDRSWMNMIRFGTTITSEAWDIKYKRNMTWNHAWGASPAYIITRRIVGIEPLEPGFSKIVIKPQPGSLESAEIKSPTIRGPVLVKFNNDQNGEFTCEVTIPANMSARMMLPQPEAENPNLTHNGNEIDFSIVDGYVMVDDILSGSHTFKLSAVN